MSARVALPARGPYRLSEAVRVFGDWLVPSTADGRGLALAMVLDGYQSTSNITLAAGGVLDGRGTVGAVTATAATLSPGDPITGILHASAVSLDSASTFTVQVNGTNQLVVTDGAGSATFGNALGSLTVNLLDGSGVMLEPRGEHELRGLSGPRAIYALRR